MIVEGAVDGVERGERVTAAGVDDGADAGEELDAPIGTEAVGDLAEDDAGAQVALGAVVGAGHLAVGDEGEQVVAQPAEALAEPDAVLVGRLARHDRVHAPVERLAILPQRGVGEPAAAAEPSEGALDVEIAKRARALGENFEARYIGAFDDFDLPVGDGGKRRGDPRSLIGGIGDV